jgi:hypothetical protein
MPHVLDLMHQADRVLVLASPAFDFAATRLPPNISARKRRPSDV